jgi:hypothetical protein
MTKSPLSTILLVALVVTSLSSVVICWLYITQSRELRAGQGQISAINNREAAIGSLINDVLLYSTNHPAIDPMLESIGLKQSKSAAAAANAAKSATK